MLHSNGVGVVVPSPYIPTASPLIPCITRDANDWRGVGASQTLVNTIDKYLRRVSLHLQGVSLERYGVGCVSPSTPSLFMSCIRRTYRRDDGITYIMDGPT